MDGEEYLLTMLQFSSGTIGEKNLGISVACHSDERKIDQ